MSDSKFDNDLNAFFNSLDQTLVSDFPDMVAETVTEEFKESFNRKSWDGVPWEPYGNTAKEPKRGSLMRRTNNLANSIRPTLVTPSLIRINAGSAKVPYARIHNEGLHVKGTRNVKQFYNRNFMGTGKKVLIKAHTRSVDFTMPRRQFMGKSQPILNSIKTRFLTVFKSNLK